jgi:hypothetical protein
VLTRLELAAKPTSHIIYPGGRFILEVPVKYENSTLVVFTNHWKSRAARSAGEDTETKRIASGKILRNLILQALSKNPNAEVIAAGDFNDEFENLSFSKNLGATGVAKELFDEPKEGKLMPVVWDSAFDLLRNPAFANLSNRKAVEEKFKMARSTYYYEKDKDYNQLDHLLLSRGLLDQSGLSFHPGSHRVVRHPKYTAPKTFAPIPFIRKQHDQDEAPGASDHFPIVVSLDYRQPN